jgi:hypothetical protein
MSLFLSALVVTAIPLAVYLATVANNYLEDREFAERADRAFAHAERMTLEQFHEKFGKSKPRIKWDLS